VLPLKSTVVFPRIFIPLSVGRKRSLQLLEDLTGVERNIAVATQLDESAEEVGFSDIHHIGAMVRVQHLLKLPDGTVQLAVLGLRRIKLTEALSEDPYLECAVEMMPESSESILTIEREALMRRAISSFQQLGRPGAAPARGAVERGGRDRRSSAPRVLHRQPQSGSPPSSSRLVRHDSAKRARAASQATEDPGAARW